MMIGDFKAVNTLDWAFNYGPHFTGDWTDRNIDHVLRMSDWTDIPSTAWYMRYSESLVLVCS